MQGPGYNFVAYSPVRRADPKGRMSIGLIPAE
jgi:hypothetical protein